MKNIDVYTEVTRIFLELKEDSVAYDMALDFLDKVHSEMNALERQLAAEFIEDYASVLTGGKKP